MRIAMIGTGYVGLVSGACFSEFGVHVTCVDKATDKIERLNKGEIPIYEPGLDLLVARNVEAGRLDFTTDLGAAVRGADAVFIAVGTPSRRGDGHADLSYVFAAAEEIARELDGYAVIVTKSTVPVGTGRQVAEIVRRTRPDAEFDVASNPEFLREGSAIEDFMRPDRVVVGSTSERAKSVMDALYRPLSLNRTAVMHTTLETSELVKYATNSFLATKITFINQVADLCEKAGANVQDVARGIGLDGRIGPKFLHPGPGYGGSCFPKDTLALVRTAQELGAPVSIVESVIAANDQRKHAMAERIAGIVGDLAGKTIAVLGLTFKPNTDDMRDSPSLVIVPELMKRGATVRAYDPEGMEEAAGLIEGMVLCADTYEALEGADALVVVTEWNEFRSLDLGRAKAALKRPLVIDLRNIYGADDIEAAGFEYHGIGLGHLNAPVEV
ncbi:MAG: UDP-glucose/GDP-mannose dehydrogenase family protein [Rhodospirillaceae bacterium]|jgi:UDPglucose 6-dehydrogenase|nr:UDP-glucose/GDP-mannose dehydrogenase family protein [Rhodospirillaceae bacterium]MBT6512130.1 UDP-glucose/GDP-mannose dehydrogenase family protein [Rhodospirillaceae bacterium]MBT7614855.1 UDP-glucose/GDP-mannose dehydrogenase family protein [Rhodospirillaceae bacterium]